MTKRIFEKDCVILIQLIDARKKAGQALKFLSSPYFGKDPKSRVLFESILEGIRKKDLSANDLWAKVVGDEKPISEGYFRVLLSRLQEKLERFLAIQEFEKDQFQVEVKRIKGLANIGWHKKADKRLQRLKKSLESERPVDQDVDYGLYFLSVLEHNLSSGLPGSGQWREVEGTWNYWSCKNWLQVYLHSTNLKQLRGESIAPSLGLKHLLNLANELFPSDPVIRTMVLLLKMLKGDGPVHASELEGVIAFLKTSPIAERDQTDEKDKRKDLNQIEWQSLFVYTFNIANREVNIGREDLYSLTAELYRTAYQKGWLYHGGEMRTSHFFSYVQYNLRVAHLNSISIKEINSFIDESVDRLPILQRDFSHRLAVAAVAMAEKKYEKARRALSRNKSENFFWEAQRRWMLVKLSYVYPHQDLAEEEEKKALKIIIHKLKDLPKNRGKVYETFLDLLEQIGNHCEKTKILEAIEQAMIPDKSFFRSLLK